MRKVIAIALFLMAGQALGATCKISEYSRLVVDGDNREVPVALEPAIAVQSVTYTTSSQSAIFNSETRFVRIICDATAHFEFGASPSAAATDPYVAADTAEYFGVAGGSDLKVAFYDGSS